MIKMIKELCRFLKGLYEERGIIYDLAVNDFKSKYTNSLLGIAWAFVLPLSIILVMWFVFQVGFRSSPVEDIPFILWYIPAYLAWNFFSEGFSNSARCIFDYNYLVKNMNFRVSTLPVVKIVSASFVHLFFIGFIIVIYLVYGYYPTVLNIQVFYYYFCLVILLLGLGWMASALAAFSKDVLNLISLVLQVGFWATPLVWDPGTMPQMVQMVVKLNPMYYICMGYRESFYGGTWFWEHPLLTLYFWVVTIVILAIGAYTFRKLRPQFADML